MVFNWVLWVARGITEGKIMAIITRFEDICRGSVDGHWRF